MGRVLTWALVVRATAAWCAMTTLLVGLDAYITLTVSVSIWITSLPRRNGSRGLLCACTSGSWWRCADVVITPVGGAMADANGSRVQKCPRTLSFLVSGTFKGLEGEVILTFRVFFCVGPKAQIECGLPYA
jgi:hypothetical protein